MSELEMLPTCMMPDGADPCKAYQALREENERLREALKPFAIEGWANEHGWTDLGCPNDRICDWFGPSEFFFAAQTLKERKDG